jgi:preprotein translocase subunit SecG
MLNFFFYLTMILFLIICMFLILLVLIQKGRGGGLASAFGGSGGNTAFGSKTGDVLTWATSVVFGVFLLLAVALNLLANAKGTPATIATAAPTPTPVTPTTPPPGGDPGAGGPRTADPLQAVKDAVQSPSSTTQPASNQP